MTVQVQTGTTDSQYEYDMAQQQLLVIYKSIDTRYQ